MTSRIGGLETNSFKSRASCSNFRVSSRAVGSKWTRTTDSWEGKAKASTSPTRRRIAPRIQARASKMLSSRARSAPPPLDRPHNPNISAPLESEHGYVRKEVQFRRNSPEIINVLSELPARADTPVGEDPVEDEHISIPIWEYPRPAPPVPGRRSPRLPTATATEPLKLKSPKSRIFIAAGAISPRKRSKDDSVPDDEAAAASATKKENVQRPGRRLTLATVDCLDQQGLMDWLAEERRAEADKWHRRRFQEAKKEISELRKLVKRCNRRISAMIESLSTDEPQALACVDLDARFQVSSRILNAWQLDVLKQNKALEQGRLIVPLVRNSKTQTELLLEQVNIIRKAGLLNQEEPLSEAQLKAIQTIAHLTEQVRTLQLVLAEGSKKLQELEVMNVGGLAEHGLSADTPAAEKVHKESFGPYSHRALKERSLSNSNSVIEQAIHELLTPARARWIEETASIYDAPESMEEKSGATDSVSSTSKAIRHSSSSESGYASGISRVEDMDSDNDIAWPKTFLQPPTPDSTLVPDIPILEIPALPEDAVAKVRTQSIAGLGSGQELGNAAQDDRTENSSGEEEEEETPFDETTRSRPASYDHTPSTSYSPSPEPSSPTIEPIKTSQLPPTLAISESEASSRRSSKSDRKSWRSEPRPVRANEPPAVILGLDNWEAFNGQRPSTAPAPTSFPSSAFSHSAVPLVPPKNPARRRHRSRPGLRSRSSSNFLQMQPSTMRKVHSDSVGSAGSRSSRVLNHVVTKMSSFKSSPHLCL